MKKTYFSIRIYSFYLFLLGLGMVLIPNILLPLLGFESSLEIWIRVLGLFTFTTGIYYYFSSIHNQTEFFKATVYGRLFFFLVILVFVFVFHQPYTLALIGSVDLLGAIWTQYCINRDQSLFR